MDVITDPKSGCRFCIATNDPNLASISQNGIHEYGLIKWCERFVSQQGTFVDIGADMGSYSIPLSKQSKEVYAFESDKGVFERLNVGLCLNNCFNIKTHNVTLSSESTEAKQSLDNYHINNITLLHISVPNELEVLKGAEMTLIGNNFPPILLECHNGETSLDYVKKLGYTLTPFLNRANLYLATNQPLYNPTASPAIEDTKGKIGTFTDIRSGLQFCMKMGNPCADHILKNGIFEYDLIKWCEQYLTSEGTFVDIGSHMGTYAIILSKKCKTVWSFEPQQDIFECLSNGVRLNDCSNINCENVALGSTEDTKQIYHVSQDGGGSTLKSTVASQQHIIGEASVITKTLDSYNLTNVDFIKIDVEGYELEVLKGAKLTLEQNKFPPFIFEAWQDEWYRTEREALLSYVREMGYNIHPISGVANMFLASDHPNRSQNNSETPKDCENDTNELVSKYESRQLDDDVTWDIWHTLANHFRINSNHAESYDCIMRGLKASSPADKEYLLYEELSIVSFYLKKMDEGYDACDKVILSPYAPWQNRNVTLNNQSFYMKKLDFARKITVNYDMPRDYIASSPSIVANKDGFLLNLRGVNYSIDKTGAYIIRDPHNIVRTRNFLLTLDNNLNVERGVELKDVSGVPLYPKNILGVEDIRLFGTNEFLCTYLEVNDSRTPQICYGHYDPETGDIDRIVPLKVGTELKCEKNWMPCIIDGEVHFIYTVSPLRLYKLDCESGAVTLIKEGFLSDPAIKLDDFRGSGGMIPYKDGWLGTIHQVYHANPRKYFHRFIWYDAAFTTMKYSDVFYFESPGIEFNLSLCHSDNGLFVAYSQNDNTSNIGVLNYNKLYAYLEL